MNVIAVTLASLRHQFALRVWIALLTYSAFAALFVIDWRIGLALMALQLARNTAGRVGGDLL